MTDTGCTVAIDQGGTVINVAIGGEFDLAAVGAVRAALEPFVADHVDIDLGAITFIDSSGLQCLLQLGADAAQGGGRLVVRTVSPVAQRLLQLTGVTDQLCDTESPMEVPGLAERPVDPAAGPPGR